MELRQLKERFAGLERRERAVLAVGFLGALVIIAYATMWAPWQDSIARLRNQVPVKQQNLAWMQQQAERVKPLLSKGRQQAPSGDQPLLTIVEQSASKANIREQIRRMAPGENDGQVKVWLTDADFDAWVIWLEILRKQGVEVIAATVNRQRDKNQVSIRVTLQRAA
jgi:type II secretory pathway component PulM